MLIIVYIYIAFIFVKFLGMHHVASLSSSSFIYITFFSDEFAHIYIYIMKILDKSLLLHIVGPFCINLIQRLFDREESKLIISQKLKSTKQKDKKDKSTIKILIICNSL